MHVVPSPGWSVQSDVPMAGAVRDCRAAGWMYMAGGSRWPGPRPFDAESTGKKEKTCTWVRKDKDSLVLLHTDQARTGPLNNVEQQLSKAGETSRSSGLPSSLSPAFLRIHWKKGRRHLDCLKFMSCLYLYLKKSSIHLPPPPTPTIPVGGGETHTPPHVRSNSTAS